MPPSPPSFTTWTGIAYRATSYDVPLWAGPNRRNGRWNIAGTMPTQYLTLDPESAWAEMLRHEDLRTERDAAMYRTSIWQLRVDEGAVVDYSTFEKAEDAGFPPDALVDDDFERCQLEAQRLQGLGARGVLSPSAALPGGMCLTLFGEKVAVKWGTSGGLASTLPAQKLTTGPPPTGLVGRTRFFGEDHAELDAYLNLRRL